MKWFKHYSDAKKSSFIREVINKQGLLGYAHYMLLLELLSEKFDGIEIKISLHVDDLTQYLQIKKVSKLDEFLHGINKISLDVLEKTQKNSITFLEKTGSFYFFESPILLDLQDRDFKLATKKRGISDAKIKDIRYKNKDIRIKNKNKEEIKYSIHKNLEDPVLSKYLEKIKPEVQELWIKTYQDNTWIKNQLLKAISWMLANNSPKKDFARFFTNWLNRSQKPVSGKKTAEEYARQMMDSFVPDEVANG